ncbi:MAG: polyphosphate polymerase domain-containing protein [Clostridia bacterium]|nr:polyphosphate polymerase domain-containing protein [Clostridia bacterium]
MTDKTVFNRYEIKYLLTEEQSRVVLDAAERFVTPDAYGRSTVRNVYYDTDNYRLIRRSIERPFYKEKLRLRSYEKADASSPVFVELKKKYDSVVYKRRIALAERDAVEWLSGASECPIDTQISKEIDYFRSFYENLMPTVFLSYEREAFFAKDNGDLRITFDRSILARCSDVSLRSDVYGEPILPDGEVLMEIKCSGGIPLWLVKVLSTEKIYKHRFSKYGSAYEKLILPRLNQENENIKEILTHA